jgi:hypothetical protein
VRRCGGSRRLVVYFNTRAVKQQLRGGIAAIPGR